MSGFSPDWLALREPLDARARSAALVDRLRAQAPRGPRRILDLGSGTGSNLRYLAPRLGGE
ncbi:MAG: class I SAM-dependent methyltransferase, partial [Chromatiales bacterium]